MEGDAGTSRLTPEDDEASPATSTIGDTETVAPVRGPRLYSRGYVVGACATLLVLSLLLAAGGVLANLANKQAQQRTTAEIAAVQAAKDCVIATQAPDVAAMAASQQEIIDCGTGDFGAQAALYSGVLVDAYQAAKAQVQVSDIRAAVERHHDDGSMDVLVALRVKMTNSRVQEQESGYRLRVRMAPDNGTYKIAKLDQVTQ